MMTHAFIEVRVHPEGQSRTINLDGINEVLPIAGGSCHVALYNGALLRIDEDYDRFLARLSRACYIGGVIRRFGDSPGGAG